MSPQELLACERMKNFCAQVLRILAPPLLHEIETATKLSPAAEPFTPRRVTRYAATAPRPPSASAVKNKKASQADLVLLKALGIAPEELMVDDRVLQEYKGFFDSPLHDQHLRAVAAIFGKVVPQGEGLDAPPVGVLVQ